MRELSPDLEDQLSDDAQDEKVERKKIQRPTDNKNSDTIINSVIDVRGQG